MEIRLSTPLAGESAMQENAPEPTSDSTSAVAGPTTSLQSIYNSIMAGKTVEIACYAKTDGDSLIRMLRRKLRHARKCYADLGMSDPYEGKYMQGRWRGADCTLIASLAEEQNKDNVRRILSVREL